MAAEFYCGSLQIPGSTGTQTITGIPFQPKGLIFFTVFSAALDAWNNGIRISTGFADADLNQGSHFHHTDDADVSADCIRGARRDRCITAFTAFGTEFGSAALTAMTSDGFSLNWVNVGIGTGYVGYVAIGGSDIAVNVGTVTVPGSDGDHAITGVGFQPDAVLLTGTPFTGADTAAGAQNSTGPMFGWYAGAAGQTVANIDHQNNANPTACSRFQSDSDCLARQQASGSISALASGVSLDSDGFTLNWSDRTGMSAGWYTHYMAIHGVGVAAGVITQPTSTGNQSVSVGVAPLFALFLSTHQTAHGSNATDFGAFSLGAYEGTNTLGLVHVDEDAVSPSELAHRLSTSKAISLVSPGNVAATGSSTVSDAEAEVTFGATSLEVDWTTADATQRLVSYLVLAAGGGGGGGTFPALTVAI